MELVCELEVVEVTHEILEDCKCSRGLQCVLEVKICQSRTATEVTLTRRKHTSEDKKGLGDVVAAEILASDTTSLYFQQSS